MRRLQRLLSGCLTAAMVCGMTIPPASALSVGPASNAVYAASSAAFTDLGGHWARDKVGRWVDHGLVSGVSADRFAPDQPLSRAQLFAIMNRLQNNTVKADISAFTDVHPDAWYYDDIAKAVAAGIASGANGKMRPDDPITRQEVAVVFTNALGVGAGSSSELDRFQDGGQVADWARGAVSAAVAHGFLNGYSNGNFGGGNSMTRAEIVAMLDSTFSGYYNAAGVFRGNVNGNVYVSANGVSLEGVIGGTLYVSPNVTDGVTVNGTRVHGNTVAAALPKPAEEEKPPAAEEKKEEEKPSGGGAISRPVGGGGGSNNRPTNPAVTVSPDRAAIVAQMTDITNGFSVKELQYGSRTHHPDHFETASHPFSSMYCSVGNIPELIRQYYQADPCTNNPGSATAPRDGSKKAGTYYEKEFLMTGTANVYDLHPNGVNVPVIKTADADYTTRLLIHYPTEASEFSGRIYVDILNASSGVDLEDIFRRSYKNMIRDGDIYIGLTSKASTAQALKNFNPVRYADLDWCVDNANKNKDWTAKENAGTFENGLVWDMISQLGTMLKEKPELLFDADLAAKIKAEGRSYLTGQSQSHFYLNTYLDVFYPYINNARDGKDIWDGYVGAVGGRTATELSTGVKIAASPTFTVTDEPYIAIMSGFEASRRLAGPSNPRYYAVPAAPMNRLYEVTSAPHACPTAAILPNNYEIAAAKPDGTSRDIKAYAGDHVEGDVHLDQFVTAALENIDLWVTDGIPAPASVVMNNDLDSWGNRTGGLRSPKIEAPVAKYYDNVVGVDPEKIGTEGSMVYFTDREIHDAYPGGYDEYKATFAAAAQSLLNDKYIIEEDYDAWMADCAANEANVFHAADSVRKSLMGSVALEDVTPAGDMETMFNSTAMSISAKYPEAWDAVAPEWAKSFEIVEGRGDNFIQLQDSMVLDGETAIVYEEKEIFVSGTASLYALAPENDLRIKQSGLPYTNRIIVRTPADPNDFTGKVWIDNLNATDKFDSEALWRRAGAMIMNNGDAYIGISSKPLTIKTLQIFGEKYGRADYNELSWASPNTYIFSSFKRDKNTPGDNVNLDAHKAGTYRDTEIINTDTGFLWDILAQTGYAAKDRSNWKTLFNVTDPSSVTINTYLFGQSQSGFNATTYALFHKALEDANVELPYDGIMTMVGTKGGARALNQSDKNVPMTEGYSLNANGRTVNYYIPDLTKTPFFHATGENDMNPDVFKPAINSGDFPKLGYFEMAGVPHSDNNTPSFPINDIISTAVTGKTGGPESSMNYLAFDPETKTYSVKPNGSDINANMFVRGLLAKLDKVASEGAAMPANQFITTITTDTANATGGLQSPQVSVPLNIYKKNGTMTPIADVPYTADEYKQQFEAKLNELAAAGWILPIDVQYMTAYANRVSRKSDIAGSMTSALEVQEKPYDAGVTYHDDVIAKSHAFNSMYCSNGKETKYDKDPKPVKFDEEYGYEEHEFFLSGTASAYNYDKARKKLSIVETDIDYTTRAMVRYPDPTAPTAPAFNGTVVVDLMNITAGYENEDLWRRSYKYLMEEGYGYVGLTYNNTGIQSLKKFDATRYADLAWYDGAYKNAIAFDVISQLGALLRTDEGKAMLGDNEIERVILTAQSSSAYYLNGYLHGFDAYLAKANNGEPLFDGYINIVGSALGIAIDNPDNYANAFMNEFPTTVAPMVAIMSEFEASAAPPFGYPKVGDKTNFWLYEVAGAPHADPMSPILPNFAEMTKANTKNAEVTDKDYAEGEYESELQLDPIVSGALDNLVKRLKDESFTMPSAANIRIEVGKTDAYGNTLGGIRMPQIEAPLATIKASASKPNGDPNPGATHGSMIYLPWEDLVTLYGDRDATPETATADALFTQYKAEFADAADRLCTAGFIRDGEKASLIAWSEKQESVFTDAKNAYDQKSGKMLDEDTDDVSDDPAEDDEDTNDIPDPSGGGEKDDNSNNDVSGDNNGNRDDTEGDDENENGSTEDGSTEGDRDEGDGNDESKPAALPPVSEAPGAGI